MGLPCNDDDYLTTKQLLLKDVKARIAAAQAQGKADVVARLQHLQAKIEEMEEAYQVH